MRSVDNAIVDDLMKAWFWYLTCNLYVANLNVSVVRRYGWYSGWLTKWQLHIYDKPLGATYGSQNMDTQLIGNLFWGLQNNSLDIFVLKYIEKVNNYWLFQQHIWIFIALQPSRDAILSLLKGIRNVTPSPPCMFYLFLSLMEPIVLYGQEFHAFVFWIVIAFYYE